MYIGGTATSIKDKTEWKSSTGNDARLAVRLVASDGDVLWTATKEIHGAKYKGASADVADIVVKQLLRELDKVKRPQPKGEN